MNTPLSGCYPLCYQATGPFTPWGHHLHYPIIVQGPAVCVSLHTLHHVPTDAEGNHQVLNGKIQIWGRLEVCPFSIWVSIFAPPPPRDALQVEKRQTNNSWRLELCQYWWKSHWWTDGLSRWASKLTPSKINVSFRCEIEEKSEDPNFTKKREKEKEERRKEGGGPHTTTLRLPAACCHGD